MIAPQFVKRLTMLPRKRIALAQLRQLYFEFHPEVQNHPERSARLLQALQSLADDGFLMLPGPDSWERVGQPVLPKWVTLVRVSSSTPTRDFARVPWVPELGFWPELKPSQLEAASVINEYLLRNRNFLSQVPIKERSLEIFGDEKRLDVMRSSNTLFSGRLSLETLGAFVVPPPLPYRPAAAPGKPVLVVENHNSYWSFGEWNQVARRYSAVVYGAGEAFRSSGAALGEVLHEVGGTRAIYLGDLDPKGVSIPLDFNRSVSDDIKVAPAIEWYGWLLLNGQRRGRPAGGDLTPLAIQWLGPELGKALRELWDDGLWIPQEGLGFKHLQYM
ncbi:MAG: Wadjet anti-phage system protein JetD domain-containing protein [Janthinobacterium lividum]